MTGISAVQSGVHFKLNQTTKLNQIPKTLPNKAIKQMQYWRVNILVPNHLGKNLQ